MNDRGVSLVEVIIVVAILAVVGGVGIFGLNAITGRPAQQCSQKIVYSLERHRVSAMGKMQSKYVLRTDGDKVFVDEYLKNGDGDLGTPSTSEVGSSGVKITYTCGSDEHELADGAPLTLEFDRSSGAFKPQADGTYCTKIVAKRGGREFEVTLVPLTGKVYIEQ